MEKVIAVLLRDEPDDDWCARQLGPVADALVELGLPGSLSMFATVRCVAP
ncbi:hypothetical protein BZL30_4906 [Mycobacterium kansasii]|uniref:Uncharacterized protein n=1 Tax=Mycobacterium kansasii TaxID=1768 RepID=A0A1V3X6Z5_MYCKA|nr:hypothetical protein BZL30_4906 [Mycobacterium kansasii]